MSSAGELEQIAPGYFMRPGALDDTTAACASICLRNPSATICLLSALAIHDLTDEIPRSSDVAIPRGDRSLAVKLAPIRWHSFDRATFAIGRMEHDLTDSITIGLYSPERTLVDVFRLRHIIGTDIANESLKRWLRQPSSKPATLLETASHFPKAFPILQSTLEILL